MSPHLITAQEFCELTGAMQPAKQCEILRSNGINFTKRADGKPSLTWEAYNRQVAAKAGQTRPATEGPRINEI